MRIKGIKIDEDVARILNEQDNDDTSKYRVYSNDIKEAIELPMDIPNEPYIEVTLDYGRPLLGYRLIDGVLYYTGRNGTKQIGKNVTLDNLAKRILSHAKNITKMNIDKIEVDDKVIWDYADGFINESINEEVLPHNLPKLNKLIDRLNNSGYWEVNGDKIRVDHGFGTVAEQMSLTDLANDFRKIGFKVYVSPFSIQVDGLEDYMEKQNNKNESMKEAFNKEDNDFPEGSFAAWYGEDLSGQTYEGDLNCSHQKLTSLFGCPSVVIGDFNCIYNQLTSLKGAPKEVEGDFECFDNKLTSLEGSPKEVGGDFDCSNNKLTSLEGAPEKVGGYFNCYGNQLTSLEGAPEKVGGYFSCSNNQLTSLKGAPKEVRGDFYCNNNKFISLEGSPKEVAGDFYCYDNRLTSLDGIGEVKGEIYIYS